MPVINTAPYDNLNTVLDLARAIINDTAMSSAGVLLSNDRNYAVTYANSAYRYLQDELIDNGVETFPKEIELDNAVAVFDPTDPGMQVYLSFDGYNDGNSNYANPALPEDMIIPLRMWERQHNVTTQNFTPMYPVNDGLPESQQKTLKLIYWEWRTDRIYMIGANIANDLKLRYIAYLPDFEPYTDNVTFGSQPVLILRSLNAMAYLVAAEFAAARGSPLADSFRAQADTFIEKMVSRTARKKQRGQHRRIPYGRGTGGIGAFGFWVITRRKLNG